jgi:phosphohistidine phosphatase SixA/ADP-ribose pyrophosphatase YjhB (NUDIX family)
LDAPLLAAGAVLWRGSPAQLAVVHRPRYDDWSLPKGKPEPGEHLTCTAVREVEEEAGVTGRLGRSLGTVSYATTLGKKRVRYWVAQAPSGVEVGRPAGVTDQAEVDEVRWLEPEKACALLTYPHDVEVVRRALRVPLTTSTVLLVRHASAGDRHAWPGPDASRPLDELGRHQAQRLAALLRSFGPDQVLSAPLTRCEQTVAPVGLEVLPGPTWSDDAVLAGVDAATEQVRALARSSRCVVVCSQGEAIPALVGALCTSDGFSLPRKKIPARKGSVWVLSFVQGGLVDADHHRHAEPAC